MKNYYSQKISKCIHNVYERIITGTWSTIEVNKAIEKGYNIVEIYEVWHFQKRSKSLFKGYVKDFMKIKLEASHHNYNSNEEYIQDIKEKLGIDLDPEKTEVNPGRRAVADMFE